jgi:copper homeostasis protein
MLVRGPALIVERGKVTVTLIGSHMILEICIDSVESALAAQEGGAARVELCADLDHGGTTPDISLIRSVRERISIPLHVMIRPRPGDFCYTSQEFGEMEREIEKAKELRVDGVVFGLLTERGEIDAGRTRNLLELARPLSVTFHRAIDESADLRRALDELKVIGADRVLTSAGKGDILQNAGLLGELVRRSDGKPTIMAGGGVNFENVREIVNRSNVREVHTLSAVLKDVSGVSQSSKSHSLSGKVVDPQKVRKMVRLLADISSHSHS